MFDKETLAQGVEYFSNWIKDVEMQQAQGTIHTIMFVNPDDQSIDDTLPFGTILPNQISKKDLELLLNKFI